MRLWRPVGLLSVTVALAGLALLTSPLFGEELHLRVEAPEDVDLGFVERGETRSVDVPLRNAGSTPISIRGDAVEITGEARRWMTITPDRLTLRPGETVIVQVAITPPRDIKPRRVVTRVRFYEEPGAASDSVGVRIKYHVPGVRLDIVSRDADVGEIAAAVVVIGNYGPDPAGFALDVVMRGGNGMARQLLEDAPGLIAPNTVERLDVLIDTTDLEVGSYQVEAWAKPVPRSETSGTVLAAALQTLFVGVLRGEVIEAAPGVVVARESTLEYRAVVRNTGNRPLTVALTGLLHDAEGHPRGEGLESATIPIGETQEVVMNLPVHRPSAALRPRALWDVLRGARYSLDATIAMGGQTQQQTDVVLVPAPPGAKLLTVVGGVGAIGLGVGVVILAARFRSRGNRAS